MHKAGRRTGAGQSSASRRRESHRARWHLQMQLGSAASLPNISLAIKAQMIWKLVVVTSRKFQSMCHTSRNNAGNMQQGGREMFEIPYGMSSLKQKSKQKTETDASGAATEDQHQHMAANILNNCGTPALGPPSTPAPLALPLAGTFPAMTSSMATASSHGSREEEMPDEVWKTLSLTVRKR